MIRVLMMAMLFPITEFLVLPSSELPVWTERVISPLASMEVSIPPGGPCGAYFVLVHADEEPHGLFFLVAGSDVRLLEVAKVFLSRVRTEIDNSKRLPTFEVEGSEPQAPIVIRISRSDLDDAPCLPKPKQQEKDDLRGRKVRV